MLIAEKAEVKPMELSQYIRNNKHLKELDFVTVYLTLITLVEEGKLDVDRI